jgi:hypothetical protein
MNQRTDFSLEDSHRKDGKKAQILVSSDSNRTSSACGIPFVIRKSSIVNRQSKDCFFRLLEAFFANQRLLIEFSQ